MEPVDGPLVLSDELRRVERHAIVARVASAFAHLIGTPLNVIAGRAALIHANVDLDGARENARRIEQQVERLAYRIRRLIEHLTLHETELDLREASQILADALGLYEPVAAARNVQIVVVSGEVPHAMLEATSTLIVLTNLLSLSTLTAPNGTRVELSVTRDESEELFFDFSVPGFEPPKFRIDRLEPPPEDERNIVNAERLQVLSICYAVAQRRGGRLELGKSTPSRIRFACPAR